MKILFITPLSPFEIESGGGVRTRKLWCALRQAGDVYTSVLKNFGDRYESRKPEENDRVKFIDPFNAKKIPVRNALMMALGAICHRMDWAFQNEHWIVNRLGWGDVKFDLVVTRFAWMNCQVAAWKIAPLLIDIDDLPSEDFNTLERPRLPRWKGFVKAWLINRWQAFSLRKARAAWIPNPFQMKIVERYCPCFYLPNIVDIPAERYDRLVSRKFEIISVGSFSYFANTLGVDWFLDNVWGALHKKFPDLAYVIIGGRLEEKYKKKWSSIPGVTYAGFVRDLDQKYAESLAVVAPVFIGGGTAIKVLEAVAHGKKVFATPFALRGLSKDQLKKANVDSFENADEFIAEFQRFLALTEEQRIAMAKEMRIMICEEYSLGFFKQQIELAITQISKERGARSTLGDSGLMRRKTVSNKLDDVCV